MVTGLYLDVARQCSLYFSVFNHHENIRINALD